MKKCHFLKPSYILISRLQRINIHPEPLSGEGLDIVLSYLDHKVSQEIEVIRLLHISVWDSVNYNG
jgi:hypothetical protein